MSRSILQSVLQNVYKISSAEFNESFRALEANANSLSSAEYSRDLLQGSIHLISLENILKFLQELYKDEAELRSVAKYYYSKLKSTRRNIVDLGDSFLVTNSVPDAAAEKAFKKLVNKRALTDEDKLKIKQATPDNGFKVVAEHVKRVNASILKEPAAPEKLKQFIKSGTDIGHVGLSSNINFLMGVVVTTGIANGVTSVSKSKEELAFLYNNLADPAEKDKLLDTFVNLLASTGSTLNSEVSEQLFHYIFDAQIELIRTLSSTGVSGKVKITLGKNAEQKILAQLNSIVSLHISKIAPQNSKLNQELGRRVEAQVRKRIPLFYAAALDSIEKKIRSYKALNQDVTELEGSPSTKKLILARLISEILGEKPTKATVKTTAKTQPIKSQTRRKPQTTKSSDTKAKTRTNPPVIRNLRGQFASQTNLFALITALLPAAIEANMKTPNLNYRTGRFAESVELKSLQLSRDGSITAFLTYMKYPYETYEPGFARAYLNKYPSSLIDQSVREVASKLVSNRLRTVII